jgi:parallel beta-helix repeat protein
MGARSKNMRLGWIAGALFLAAAVFCLWAGQAAASGVAGGDGDVYYVDISVSDDSGDGSEGNPFKFLHTAFGVLQSGDTLYIQPGIYSVGNGEPNASITWYNGSLRIIGNGAPGDVVIDGTGASSWYSGIRFYSEAEPFVRDVLIENIDIRNFTISGSYDTGNGISIEGDAGDISILNCRIYQNAQTGIYLTGSRHRVENCVIYDNGAVGSPGAGIFVQAEKSVISGNSVYWSGAAAYPQGVGVHLVASGNHVCSNEIYGHTSGTNPSGIQIDYTDAQIYDNDISDNTVGVHANESAPDIFRNLIKDN